MAGLLHAAPTDDPVAETTGVPDRGPVSLDAEACQTVRRALEAQGDAAGVALWVEVSGVQGETYTYDLYFADRARAAAEDSVSSHGDLVVVVPAASVRRLSGARLECGDGGDGGLVLVNPNRPTAGELLGEFASGPSGSGPDSDLAVRVRRVLEKSVNPSIAGHGGRADLVGLDEADGVAYLRLSGGCQGCALSRTTLTEGIAVTLREEVAELSRVVDVTDHRSGDNPYY
ncbi:MAG TPA: NifU family protein [Acidimicrobiales bacterium]|jgi:Fe/S biogenesis protein NfuA